MPETILDPINFSDKIKYLLRIKKAQINTKQNEINLVTESILMGMRITLVVFNFCFMGGSMGISGGENIIVAARNSLKKKFLL